VLARQLAHTYHYYLHPGGVEGGEAPAAAVPVHIEVCGKAMATADRRGERHYAEDWELESLGELLDLEGRYLRDGAGKPFTFELTVKHPDDDGHDRQHVVRAPAACVSGGVMEV
jgi:hypothetical protein